jgi:DNA-binding XRE family transcriptional regulator
MVTDPHIGVSLRLLSATIMSKPLDTTYYARRRQDWLADEETRAAYERARREIEQIDAVIRSLDQLRVNAGMSKAELARRVGRNPASIRRLFTAEQARPELPLIVSIANALDASVEITPHTHRSTRKQRRRAAVRA